MPYLLIENPGIVGTDLLTVVGASTARSDEDMIGQFGSGFKYSISLLLRNSIDVRLYIGKEGFEFGVDERDAKDVAGRNFAIKEVVMKQVAGNGRRTKPMGFDVTFGECDWQDVGMAVREFISNAADACKTQDGDYRRCRVEIVDDNQVRAKSDCTRVFIQLTQPIREFFNQLHHYFLIFDESFDAAKKILPKKDSDSNLRIYRKGVLVGTFPYKSLFDYNINDISLKESRVITEYDARFECTMALKKSSVDCLVEWLQAVRDNRDVFEVNTISIRDLKQSSWSSNEEVASRWKEAISRVFEVGTVACGNTRHVGSVSRKGYTPVVLPPNVVEVLSTYSMKTAEDVLDVFEVSGRERFELTPSQMRFAMRVWQIMGDLGVTDGKSLPDIEGYYDVMDGGTNILGYYDSVRSTVGFSRDILDSTFLFIKTAIEEFGHYITRADDESRDLQDFAFRVAGKLMEERFNDVQ